MLIFLIIIFYQNYRYYYSYFPYLQGAWREEKKLQKEQKGEIGREGGGKCGENDKTAIFESCLLQFVDWERGGFVGL